MTVHLRRVLPLLIPLLAALAVSACSNQPYPQEPTYVPAQRQGQSQSRHHHEVEAPSHRQQAEAPAPAAAMLIKQGDQATAAGQPQRALDWLERAQRISPGAPGVYLALARAHAAMAHYRQAQQLVFKALSLAGDDASARVSAWSLMADIRHAAGDASGAAAARNKAAQY